MGRKVRFVLGKYNIFLCIFGVIYLIYSLLFRNKVTVYNKRSGMVIVNKEKFLKIQLYFSIINSVVMITIGAVVTVLNVVNTNIVLIPLLFHLINYLLIFIAKKKGYIQYNW